MSDIFYDRTGIASVSDCLLVIILYMSLMQDNPALEKLIKHFTTKTTKEKFQSHMSDINGGFNKTAKELQDFVLNQARIADRKGSKSANFI